MLTGKTFLISRIDSINKKLEEQVKAAAKQVAENVAETARDMAPIGEPDTMRDTHPGNLRDSIHVIEAGSSDGNAAEGHQIGYRVIADAKDDRGVPYAHMVEYGSVHNPAEPPRAFLGPAKEQHTPEYEAVMSEYVKDLDP